jgi:hypothetical protein
MLVLRLVLTVMAGLFAVPGCGLLRSGKPESSQRSISTDIPVEVESHNWSDIVIYLMDGNQSRRLGMVAGLSTKSFFFPYRKLTGGGEVRLRAYPVGGPGSFTSEDLLVQPGQGIKWTLESDLARSSMSVY